MKAGKRKAETGSSEPSFDFPFLMLHLKQPSDTASIIPIASYQPIAAVLPQIGTFVQFAASSGGKIGRFATGEARTTDVCTLPKSIRRSTSSRSPGVPATVAWRK